MRCLSSIFFPASKDRQLSRVPNPKSCRKKLRHMSCPIDGYGGSEEATRNTHFSRKMKLVKVHILGIGAAECPEFCKMVQHRPEFLGRVNFNSVKEPLKVIIVSTKKFNCIPKISKQKTHLERKFSIFLLINAIKVISHIITHRRDIICLRKSLHQGLNEHHRLGRTSRAPNHEKERNNCSCKARGHVFTRRDIQTCRATDLACHRKRLGSCGSLFLTIQQLGGGHNRSR